VLRTYEDHLTEFDIVNFVTAFHRVAKLPDGKAVMSSNSFSDVARQLLDKCP